MIVLISFLDFLCFLAIIRPLQVVACVLLVFSVDADEEIAAPNGGSRLDG